MLWLIGTALALRNFLTQTTLGGFTQFIQENRDFLVFGGVWALREIPGPDRQKNSEPKKNRKKNLKFSFFPAVSKNMFFVENGAVFLFSALGAPYRGRVH